MITGQLISIDIPQVAAGQMLKANIDWYVANNDGTLWKTFLIATSYQLWQGNPYGKVLDQTVQWGGDGGDNRAYDLANMPNENSYISFFLFGTPYASQSWDWNSFRAWMDWGYGLPDGMVHLASFYGSAIPGNPPVPQSEFRNLTAYQYTNPVKAGQNCRVEVQFEYQGPALSKLLHAAIGSSGWGGFDEILTGEVWVQIPETQVWTQYYVGVDVPVTTAINPANSPYSIYAKFNGVFPTIISPTLVNVLMVGTDIPASAWKNVKIVSYTAQVDQGGTCQVRVTCEYQGPACAENLHASIGQILLGMFDEIEWKDQLFFMPEARSWTSVTMDIAVPVTSAIDPTHSPYCLYVKIGGVSSPTLTNVIVVNGGNPVPNPEFRNLMVTSWTTPVKVGQNCKISVSWDYRGSAMSKVLYAAIGSAGWAGFDEIITGSVSVQIPKSDDWTTYYVDVNVNVSSAIDPANSPYSCYAKFDGAFPEIVSPTQQDVIIVQGTNPQFRNLVIKTVTSPVSVGNTCWIETIFEYLGPATSKQLYGAIGIKGIFGFDEVLNATQDINIPACASWSPQTGKIPIFISEGIDPSKSPYDVYAKIASPEVISPVKMGAVIVVATPGSGEITGQIVGVQPATIKTGSPLELNVQIQAFDDNAWQQINGWWTRTTVTLGTLSGKVDTIHLGRDATDTIKVLLGVMGKTVLTGKAVLEGCPGGAVVNPISPTPPTTGWYKVAEKAITITPSGVTPPPAASSSWGLVAVAGIAVLALANGSGKSKS
ncbi:hypothetical protein [Dehalococcoides mccartyi]|uniref:hypothetical protein n=1 Tax=Dehalococcoides mccartyi TaxID=61435 RepID=UPI0006BDC3CE|nr:hypothetical protein [Dehalococcoides mccartyi]BAS31217.1 hypothetical protein IBK_0142 [Dehalococcoides mccartyi IBARAKI]